MEETDLKEENLKLRREITNLEQQVLETSAEIEVVKPKADELMMDKIKKYEDELDRVKRENNDLHNKVAALLDAVNPLEKMRRDGL